MVLQDSTNISCFIEIINDRMRADAQGQRCPAGSDTREREMFLKKWVAQHLPLLDIRAIHSLATRQTLRTHRDHSHVTYRWSRECDLVIPSALQAFHAMCGLHLAPMLQSLSGLLWFIERRWWRSVQTPLPWVQPGVPSSGHSLG